jgi:hypothetical protein
VRTCGTGAALQAFVRSLPVIVASLAAIASSLVLVTACSSAPGDGASVTSSDADEKLSLDTYDPSAAVTYADNNWNNGQGECAEFTTRSLIAGHLAIGVIPYVPNLFTALASVGYEEHTQGSKSVSAKAGDVVIYSNATGANFCDAHSTEESNCGHACIITVAGTTEDGIEVDCHNNAHYHLGLGYILGSGGYTTYRIYHLAGKTSGSAPAGTQACSTDDDCNGGESGSGVVCAAGENYCIKGCHTDDDCPDGTSCTSTSPHWSCQ